MAITRKIPKLNLWYHRYKAYRKKYRPFKAFWRGVVMGEMYSYSSSIMVEDETELLGQLVHVEVVSVELHL